MRILPDNEYAIITYVDLDKQIAKELNQKYKPKKPYKPENITEEDLYSQDNPSLSTSPVKNEDFLKRVRKYFNWRLKKLEVIEPMPVADKVLYLFHTSKPLERDGEVYTKAGVHAFYYEVYAHIKNSKKYPFNIFPEYVEEKNMGDYYCYFFKIKI